MTELYARELAPDTGGGSVDLTYDFAGNLLRQQLQSGGCCIRVLDRSLESQTGVLKNCAAH